MINTCGSSKCSFCTRGSLDTNSEYTSNCSGITYHVDFPVSCRTTSCIYLISCSKCQMKYVGKTKNSIRERLNGHRAHMLRGTESFVMYEHVAGNIGHGISSMKIKAIEICNKDTIKDREKYWLNELNTIFPYGLNTDGMVYSLKNAYNIVIGNTSNTCIYSYFNTRVSKRTKKGGRHTGLSDNIPPDLSSGFDAYEWTVHAVHLAMQSPNLIHRFRTLLFELNKTNLKSIYLLCANMITQQKDLTFTSPSKYMVYIIKDLCLHRIKQTQPPIKSKKSAFLTVRYVNKLLEIFQNC